jgi:hypothetical protein
MAKPKRKNGGTTMSSSERDLALAKALLDRGEMDAAEELLDKVESKMSAQAAADDADDEEEDTLDQEDDSDDQEEEDDSEEEDDGDVSKAFREGGITYPHSDDAFLASGHQNMGPVSADRLSPYPRGTGVTDVVQRPGRHPFDDAVDRVMARDGSSRNAAMVTARLENPRLYDDYQRAHAMQSTSQQGMSRIWSTAPVSKLGLPKTPPIYPDSEDTDLQDSGRKKKKTHARRVRRHNQQVKTHEDAVADQMAKGLSREIAEQRVLYAYGNTLPRSNIAKGAGDTPIVKFMDKVDQCMINEDVDRTEAMRRVRKRHEGLFDAFQIV